MPTSEAPAVAEYKPLLLRARIRIWRNHYMVGPGEVCGDLHWWTPSEETRIKPGEKRTQFTTKIGNEVHNLPEGSEVVDPATVEAEAMPVVPPRHENVAPGGGPPLRREQHFPTAAP
jgi:hypothetical protein